MEGREEDVTEDIYLGDIPVMLGGGEFIVNGAMRVIVSQLHRSPGIDFSIAQTLHDRPLHSAKIVPERGSWIELEVTEEGRLGHEDRSVGQDCGHHVLAGVVESVG